MQIETKMDIWQTAYDMVVKQGRKSNTTHINESGNTEEMCAYLAENGDKCAFGHLLPTEWIKKNQREIETWTADYVMKNLQCPDNWNEDLWKDPTIQHFCLIIQSCHDYSGDCDFVDDFQTRMESIRPS